MSLSCSERQCTRRLDGERPPAERSAAAQLPSCPAGWLRVAVHPSMFNCFAPTVLNPSSLCRNETQNLQAMKRVDTSGNGEIEAQEFLQFYRERLGACNDNDFDRGIRFMSEVAREVRSGR